MLKPSLSGKQLDTLPHPTLRPRSRPWPLLLLELLLTSCPSRLPTSGQGIFDFLKRDPGRLEIVASGGGGCLWALWGLVIVEFESKPGDERPWTCGHVGWAKPTRARSEQQLR